MRIADVFVAIRADPTEFNAAIRGLDQNLKNVSRNLGQIGSAMTRNITLPIVALAGGTSKFALDFERTMGQLVGLAGVSKGSIDGLRDSIFELSRETGKGPQDLAEAFYFVASAGFEAEEAMEVLEVAARSSAAGMGETQDIARVLGQVINTYGKENIDAARAADILTAAVAEGSAEADDFAAALPTVIGSAAQLDVSFEQLLGTVAALSITSKDARQATVGLNQVFTTLINPTTKTADALSEVDLSAAQLRDMLADPAQGPIAVLRLLEDRFGGNVEAMGEVFGNVRALRAAFSLLNLDAGQLDEIMGNVADSVGANADAFGAIPEDVLA
ncbi:MAG TPA: phage tail tape measure protein, partial [Gemmatimonadales bacterium]|nr:phage tail tape measure protein [Gemmatimonadales bacterium]